METQGRLESVTMDLNGNYLVTFHTPFLSKASLESLSALRGAELDITAVKHRNKRSLDSNAYLWVLCDKIAKKVGTDRERVYVMELERYGKFEDISIRSDAVEEFQRNWKYTDVRYTGDGWTVVRVFYGSSLYDSKEMSDLIAGVVADADDLGIPTMTPDEIARMNSMWGKHNGNMETD